MKIVRYYGPNAGPDFFVRRAALAFATTALVLIAGCAQVTPPPATPVAAAPPPPAAVVPVPFPDAVLKAANGVFTGALANAGPSTERRVVVIDPLVNGVTGEQSVATKQIQQQIADLAREKYPQFDMQPFTAAAVSKGANVMVGTFTPVNAQGATAGVREAYRFCLVMVDLKAGKTIAKSVARAQVDGVNTTPIGFFRDSPAWTADASIKSYIDTCQATKVGDPVSPVYVNGIVTASIISEAIDAYDASHYGQSLELYQSAEKTAAGNQLRVYNGLYLTHWKLGHREPAAEAFGRVVDFGLKNNSLGVKILFKAGSTALTSDPRIDGPYDMWLRQIASHSASGNACLQVTGNSSPSGSAVINEQLSQLRADYVKGRLETDQPALHGRVIATGVGAKNNMIGTGADDASDALDRRVEFKVIPSC